MRGRKRRPAPAHEPDDVTDDWSGGRENLADMIPDGERPDAHEHGHHDGALFYHEHACGQEPHDHEYWCDGEDAGAGAGCYSENQAAEDSAVYQ